MICHNAPLVWDTWYVFSHAPLQARERETIDRERERETEREREREKERDREKERERKREGGMTVSEMGIPRSFFFSQHQKSGAQTKTTPSFWTFHKLSAGFRSHIPIFSQTSIWLFFPQCQTWIRHSSYIHMYTFICTRNSEYNFNHLYLVPNESRSKQVWTPVELQFPPL